MWKIFLMEKTKYEKTVTYYILLPGDTVEDASFDSNLLGEIDIMGTFWAGTGLHALMNISSKNPELLPNIRIITDSNQKLSIDDFLKIISDRKIKYNRL